MNKYGIIGVGNIGSAVARALLAKARVKPEDLFLCDRQSDSIDSIIRDYPAVQSVAVEQISDVDCLLIAVKPQDFYLVAKKLVNLNKNCLIISLMAGHSLQTIAQETNCTRVIRCMSNLPALCSMGMNVYCAAPAVNQVELKAAQDLIGAFGLAIQVEHEDLINSATAVSGSGPAYVYYFIQALAEAAHSKGFTPEQAKDLAIQTFHGAIHYYLSAECPLDELIQRVATKGGTTEAALNVFANSQLNKIIQQGVDAAYQRSCQMQKS